MIADLNKFFVSEEELLEIGNVERKKHLQRLKIMKYLFLNGKASNAAICKVFKLSLPTSMGLINQLLTDGVIVKKGRGKSDGGRKPDLYGLAQNSFFIVSVHIGRFGIKIAILDNNHNLVNEEIIPATIGNDLNIVDLLYKNIKNLIKRSKVDDDLVMGIGISMPGLVSTREGKNFTYYLSEQEPESLKDKLARKFNKLVVLLNDAKSACLAEYNFGEAKNAKDALVISMDWGTGLGIIMGGKIQDGTSGFAGEFGHIPLIENGLLCHCGKHGCLETEASGLALVRKTKEALAQGQNSILSTLSSEEFERMDAVHIITAANKGDQFAIKMLAELGTQLGKGLAILVQLFNPERIILAGKIAGAKEFITTSIQQSMNTYCMMQLKEKTSIALSQLGPNTNLYGATIAVMDAVFKNKTTLIKNSIN